MRQDRYSLHVDRTATIAEVALALGGDIHAHPPTLWLGEGVRGGGEFSVTTLLEQAETLKAVGEWVGVGLVAWKAALTVYYPTPRRPAKGWIDSGAVSMKLRRAVLATDTWERKTFDRAFRLRDRGPELCWNSAITVLLLAASSGLRKVATARAARAFVCNCTTDALGSVRRQARVAPSCLSSWTMWSLLVQTLLHGLRTARGLYRHRSAAGLTPAKFHVEQQSVWASALPAADAKPKRRVTPGKGCEALQVDFLAIVSSA